MPSAGSVHIDRALTNISIMYKNEEYIADMVFPPIPVEKRSDKYFIYDKSMMLRGTRVDANSKPASLRRPGASAAEINWTLSNDSYYAQEYALKELVTDVEREEADSPLEIEVDTTEMLTERVKLDNEIMVATMVGNSSNYPSSGKVTLTTGGSGTSWASYTSSNSKPLNNLRDGRTWVRSQIMRRANTLAITSDAALVLADHPDIKDLIKYTNEDALTLSGLPRNMRGLSVLEGSAQMDTSKEGQTFSGGNVWKGSDGYSLAVVCYVNKQNGGRKSIHFGRTFEAPDATTKVRGYATRKWRDNDRKGTMIEVSTTRDYKFIALDGSSKALGGYGIFSCMV